MGILIEAPSRRQDTSGTPANAPAVATAEPAGALHIREVVRITGLRREQLYMWQRRYGFPAPLPHVQRSGEHPSGLQSRRALVCLHRPEKKKSELQSRRDIVYRLYA